MKDLPGLAGANSLKLLFRLAFRPAGGWEQQPKAGGAGDDADDDLLRLGGWVFSLILIVPKGRVGGWEGHTSFC